MVKKMVMCLCGKDALLRTSWTDCNPGRRFYVCPDQIANCGFFGWMDPELCNQDRDLIPGLVRGKIRLEEHLRKRVDEAKKWKKYMIPSWVVFATGLILFLI